jgi:mono/diheme cytochrome c family protein
MLLLAVLSLASGWVATLHPSAAQAEDPPDYVGDADPGDPERIERGRILFGRGCGNDFCHGLNGEGHPVLKDARKINDSIWHYNDGSYAGVLRIVMEGLPASPMEPWAAKWGIEKVRDVAAYVLTLSKDK